jgi:hypothetical protein
MTRRRTADHWVGRLANDQRVMAAPKVWRATDNISRDGQPLPRQRTVAAFEHFVTQWERKGYGREPRSTSTAAAGLARSA